MIHVFSDSADLDVRDKLCDEGFGDGSDETINFFILVHSFDRDEKEMLCYEVCTMAPIIVLVEVEVDDAHTSIAVVKVEDDAFTTFA